MWRRWRRLDYPGLELARIDVGADGITVVSSLIDAGDEPFALRYRWTLDSAWRTRSLLIEQTVGGAPPLLIERAGDAAWRIAGQTATHLDGCVELDVSATPVCNGLAIRRLGGDGDLTAAYVQASALSVQPSHQRYERIDERTWRYIDLGVAKGFTALLELDPDGLVERYEGLFEALT